MFKHLVHLVCGMPADAGLFVALDRRMMDVLAASGALEGYHLLHSARADLLRRMGRFEPAAAAYQRALLLATNPVERSFLERRLDEVRGRI